MRSLREEQLSAIEKFVSGQDAFVSLPTGFGNVRSLATASIAKHIQRYTYVLLDSASVLRSFTDDVLQY